MKGRLLQQTLDQIERDPSLQSLFILIRDLKDQAPSERRFSLLDPKLNQDVFGLANAGQRIIDMIVALDAAGKVCQSTGWPALYRAILWGLDDLAITLLKQNPISDLWQENGTSPLHLAVQARRSLICEAIIEHGFYREVKDRFLTIDEDVLARVNQQLFTEGGELGTQRFCELLAQHGVQVSPQQIDEFDPAIYETTYEVKPFNSDQKDQYGRIAFEYLHLEPPVIDSSMSPSSFTLAGRDILGFQEKQQDALAIQNTANVFLRAHQKIQKHAFVGDQSYNEFRIQSVVQALQMKSSVNITDEGGQTPLHIAAESGGLTLVHVCMKGGADVLARNQVGLTPMAMLAQDQSEVGQFKFRLLQKAYLAELARVAGGTKPDREEKIIHELLTHGLTVNTMPQLFWELQQDIAHEDEVIRKERQQPNFDRSQTHGSLHVDAQKLRRAQGVLYEAVLNREYQARKVHKQRAKIYFWFSFTIVCLILALRERKKYQKMRDEASIVALDMKLDDFRACQKPGNRADHRKSASDFAAIRERLNARMPAKQLEEGELKLHRALVMPPQSDLSDNYFMPGLYNHRASSRNKVKYKDECRVYLARENGQAEHFINKAEDAGVAFRMR